MSDDKFIFWKKRARTPEPKEVDVQGRIDSKTEISGPDNRPIEIATPAGSPAEVRLSGEVDVTVTVRQPDAPAPTPAPLTNDEVIENRTDDNMFKTLRYQESGLDEVQIIRVLCFDPANGGRRTNVADVRRRYGRRLDLGNKHESWCNGVKVHDDYEPQAGSELMWKEDAKGRQA